MEDRRKKALHFGICGFHKLFALTKKPNISLIFGEDIGQSQIRASTMRLMGDRTPNIDRIAGEGVIFTDAYA